jgi:hypothetical protein
MTGSHGGSKIWFVVLATLGAGVGAIAQETAYEEPPTLSASGILAPAMLRGEHHEVAETVTSDGYMNFFIINSDYGQFEAYSELMLAVRIQEIAALAELDELSKTKVFADAVTKGAMSQVESVKEFAEKPVATMKGMPGGVKRMFKRTKWNVEEGVEVAKDLTTSESGDGSEGDDESTSERTKELAKEGVEASEKYAKKYFGVSKAERRWAEKLGIDPYTSNEILRREIKRVAKVDAAGSFGVRLAPIPRIPGVSYVQDINKLVWSTHPRELRELNMKRLAEMGADEELATRLLDNPWYSPSTQTYLVALLVDLEEAEDRVVAVEQAAVAASREEARFFLQALGMVGGFHRHRTPIARLVGGARLPAALTAEGRLVFLVPVDDIFWTQGIAEAASGSYSEAGVDLEVTSREVWFRGGVSARCRRELEDRGWRVFAEVDFSAEESAGIRK